MLVAALTTGAGGGTLGAEVKFVRALIAGRSLPLVSRVNMYSPHHGPADHHVQPSHTSELFCTWVSMLLMASSPMPAPMVELATANSPRKPRRALFLHHCVKLASRSAPMVALTMVALVPEESLSRYWWTSKAKLFPESVMVSMTVAFGVP